MVGQRDGVRTSRLIRLAFIAIIGLAFFVLVVVYSIRQLSKPRAVSDAAASTQTARQSELAQDGKLSASALASSEPSPLDPILDLARSALANMNASVLDYTARLEKQERIDGELAETQFMELKVISRSPRNGDPAAYPLHAYFKFVEPSKAAGREVIYVEGKNNGNLVAHEAGFMNVMRVSLAPTSYLAMKGNKYPASQVGIENLLKKLIEKGERDRSVPGCQVSLQKGLPWEDRIVDKIVVTHPEKTADVDFHLAEILIDTKLQLPVSYAAYLWPAEDNASELPLEEKYIYHELQINVGLTEEDFNPDNPAYDYP